MITRSQILETIREEPYVLGYWVGFKDLTEMHNEWLKDFLFRKDDQTKQAHRGSFKTSCLELFLAIHTIIKPNESVIYFRKTDADVAAVARTVAKILQTGAFEEIVRMIYGKEIKLLKATDTEIDTNLRTGIGGQSQIIGLGINGSITGKHADIVITDDIVTIKDRISPAERKHTKTQFMELINVKNRNGRFINTGTPWHKDDCFTIMPEAEKYDCYSTGLISRGEIEDIRSKMTSSLFAANYELKHIANEDALFTAPTFTNDVEKIYDGICHIDASYGGSDGTAFTILKKHGDELYMFGKRWNKHVDGCIPEILQLKNYYRAGTIYCELNADKGYLAKALRGMGEPVGTYHERANKYIKIASYLKAEWGHIKWLNSTDPEYINEILDYTENAAHDDSPDSAASIIRQTQKTGRLKTFAGGI